MLLFSKGLMWPWWEREITNRLPIATQREAGSLSSEFDVIPVALLFHRIHLEITSSSARGLAVYFSLLIIVTRQSLKFLRLWEWLWRGNTSAPVKMEHTVSLAFQLWPSVKQVSSHNVERCARGWSCPPVVVTEVIGGILSHGAWESWPCFFVGLQPLCSPPEASHQKGRRPFSR